MIFHKQMSRRIERCWVVEDSEGIVTVSAVFKSNSGDNYIRSWKLQPGQNVKYLQGWTK